MSKKQLKQRIVELEEENELLKEQIERYRQWNQWFPRTITYPDYKPVWYVEPFRINWVYTYQNTAGTYV